MSELMQVTTFVAATDDRMSAPIYLITLGVLVATVLIVFGMRYFAGVQQARARLANDDAYRKTAETAAVAESASAASLASIEASVTEIKTRLAAVEKILKDVG
jgi:Tfp pilus assembly protein PilO